MEITYQKCRANKMNINNNPKNLNATQHNVLVGHLLGDGCLNIKQNAKNPRLIIRRQLTDLAYIQYTADIFKDMCRPKAVTTGVSYHKKDNRYDQYCNLESRYIPGFLDYHNKWYIKNDKNITNRKYDKIIPNDLKLNREIIAIWLCDDGCVRIYGNNRIRITFHTQGFLKHDVYFLKHLLDQRYGVNFTIQLDGKKLLTIVGHDHQSRALIEDIDPIFPISMSRKSNIWRNPNVNLYNNIPRQFGNWNSHEIYLNLTLYLLSGENKSVEELVEKYGYRYNNSSIFPSVQRFFKKCLSDKIIISNLNDFSYSKNLNYTLYVSEDEAFKYFTNFLCKYEKKYGF